MLRNLSPPVQALLATLFTWFLTALGAASVFLIQSKKVKHQLLSTSLGFAGGVMLSASYFSLLAPAAELGGVVPVCGGFLFGALFINLADYIIGEIGEPTTVILASSKSRKERRKMLLLIAAITVHNIPEGLAVGVAFGGNSFESARNLAIAIGLQNFPEGLAVSLPLAASGMGKMEAFWYGQLSGMVEPIAGVGGALAISLFTPLLPWALAFAAGAMIHVVVRELVPESSWTHLTGFIIMMALDVGLG